MISRLVMTKQAVAASIVATLFFACLVRGSSSPNIVVILADDESQTGLVIEVLDQARPALGNSVLSMALIGCLMPPLWLFIPLVILRLRRTSYRVEAERVVVEQGILYRSHTSVLFGQIQRCGCGEGGIDEKEGVNAKKCKEDECDSIAGEKTQPYITASRKYR